MPVPTLEERDLERAEALLGEGQAEAAGAAFERVLQRTPGVVRALTGLASAMLALNRLDQAETLARQALAASPDEPLALRSLSAALQMGGRHREALDVADAILARDPQHGEAWLARGDSLANLDRHAEALAAFETARRDAGLAFEVLVRMGALLGAQGRPEEAVAALDESLRLAPDAAAPRLQRAVLRLSLRDFAAGWDDYEARWRSPRFVASGRGIVPKALAPVLATRVPAAALSGKRVMLIGEQGVGDQLMFASMAPDLARVAARVVCVCEPRLVRLFANSLQGVTVLSPANAQIDTDEFDAILAMGSLGFTFRRAAEAFTGAPYLRPTAAAAAAAAEWLGPRTTRLRVGLSWRGGLPATRRDARSLSLDQLRPILELPDCEFVSLQYGEVDAEVAAANARLPSPIRLPPAARMSDFDDLAGLAQSLDVVVSVQTAAVHLCGALGQTCLTLVPTTPVWRYGASGPDMPWYRSVRLFRQAEPGAWERPVAEIAAALRQRLR